MCQHEIADLAIKREAMRAVADRNNEHGRWPVHGIARGHLLVARSQECGVDHVGVRLQLGGSPQHREDRSDHAVDIDI
jgi:hypothetical protein